jgi:hypothetical protein
MNALEPTIARSFLRQLSGFRGYPRDSAGEGRFVEVLCEVSISVEHALAITWAFEENFPTIREIRDTALNLRAKFEAKVDQKKEWESKYGKPDLAWYNRISNATNTNYAEERRAMLWQAIRDSIFYTETPMGRADLARIDDKDERINAFKFWRQAAKRNQRDHPTEVEAFRAELEQSGWDELMVYDWAKGEFPPCAVAPSTTGAVAVLERPITAEDINRELRAQGREAGDGE